jgi:hypothetical protein
MIPLSFAIFAHHGHLNILQDLKLRKEIVSICPAQTHGTAYHIRPQCYICAAPIRWILST